MKYLPLLTVPTLAALVYAQSAPDFPIEVKETLTVEWSASSTKIEAGAVIARESE